MIDLWLIAGLLVAWIAWRAWQVRRAALELRRRLAQIEEETFIPPPPRLPSDIDCKCRVCKEVKE